MNIYKLLGGVLLTVFCIVVAPVFAEKLGLGPQLTQSSWLILLIAALGLIIKSICGDFVAGEFLFYKFGYDNCVLAFGALLTALALQVVETNDMFKGMDSVILLSDIKLSADPANNRSAQLLVFLLISFGGMMITGAISAAIKKQTARGPAFLSLLNTVIGVMLLSVYVLVLVSKG